MVSGARGLRVAGTFVNQIRAQGVMRHFEQRSTKRHICGGTTWRSSAARIRRLRLHKPAPKMAGPLGEVGFGPSGAEKESSVVSEMRGRRSC